MTLYIDPGDGVAFVLQDLEQLVDGVWATATSGVTGEVRVINASGVTVGGPYALSQVGATSTYVAEGAAPVIEGRYKIRYDVEKDGVGRTIWDELVVDVGSG